MNPFRSKDTLRLVMLLLLVPLIGLVGCDDLTGTDDGSCTDLPQISVGQSQTGALSTSDPESETGEFFDSWGLRLNSSRTIQIDMTSDQVDTYLRLFDSEDELIERNDDGGTGFNARMVVSLNEGCYRIQATSFADGDTGEYTLTVTDA